MRIKQGYVGAMNFRNDFLKKWNLLPYTNRNTPAVFFGVYQNTKKFLLNHRSSAIVVWAGGDAMRLNKRFVQDLNRRKHIEHIAISNFISRDLTAWNIPHILLPVTPVDYSIFKPVPLGDSLYMYLPKKKGQGYSEFYGASILKEVEKAFPKLNIIISHFGKVSRSQLSDLYAKCFMGLRPTPHDGMSNTVVELGLMGRKCIWNGNTPNAIPFTDTDSIIRAIKEERKKIGYDQNALAKKVADFVNIGTDWLDLEYIFKEKIVAKAKKDMSNIDELLKTGSDVEVPIVSIIMNTINEKPEILSQAIDSYLKQEGVTVQLIISSVKGDPSEETAKNYGVDFCGSDKPGIYEQINKAIPMVRGDWFAYASGNDIAVPTKLIHEIECCTVNKKLVCYSDFRVVDEHLNLKGKRIFHSYDPMKHLSGNFVNDCALMHRCILEEFAPFDLKWGNHAYWDLWLRVYEKLGNVFCYNASFEWLYRQQGTSSHTVRAGDEEKKKKNHELMISMINHHKRLRKLPV